ncbi:MAG: HNH endonuclease [Lachnospiraceae bacterium]|nr:HNH endonuclease [Lachnospiraceae bacterium]
MIPAKYKNGNAYDKLMNSADKNRIITHAAKITETFCDFIVLCDEVKAPLGFDYLCTATCGSGKEDFGTKNAADKPAQGFLFTKVKEKGDKTIRELLLEDDPDLRTEIEESIGPYDIVKDKLLHGIKKAESPKRSDGFLRQVYFPVGGGYHLLSILPSSVLVDQVSTMLPYSGIEEKIKTYVATTNTVNTMGTMLMARNSHPFSFRSLPPYSARKTLQKALKREYLVPDFNIDALDWIRNGMLVDATKLEVIINEGIRKGEGNWRPEKERAERKPETIAAFLEKYGYEYPPVGYEVHHIVPIAQSGADVVENLVLLTAEDHQKVTDRHNEVFKWNI